MQHVPGGHFLGRNIGLLGDCWESGLVVAKVLIALPAAGYVTNPLSSPDLVRCCAEIRMSSGVCPHP